MYKNIILFIYFFIFLFILINNMISYNSIENKKEYTNIDKEYIYSGSGGGGNNSSNYDAPNKLKSEVFKDIISIVIYFIKLTGFIILIFVGLDINKMMNDTQQKNNSTEGLILILKILVAMFFLKAEIIADKIFHLEFNTK